ncbi:ATP-binding protein [Paenibacillus qinlingensis]|uniref:ATP-binding protein n=1 Tax=Paenibacillus qinlingensis TaxID=1837343 RepID=UPI0015647B8D|nr:ATP-binding protein [Paenibacillus qinlingensis]NQX60801.1 response regulator [Paenibacillus qinlingensis]
MPNLVKSSISRRFVRMILFFALLVMVGAIGVSFIGHHVQQSYQERITLLKEKEKATASIYLHYNQIFLHARAFYAFRQEFEYEAVMKEKPELEQAMETFVQLPLTDQEKELLTTLKSFEKNYFDNVFPKYVKLVHNEDPLAIVKAGATTPSGSVGTSIYDLLGKINDISLQTSSQSETEARSLFKTLSNLNYVFFAYVCGILIFITCLTSITAKNMGRPLRKLADHAEKVSLGQSVEFEMSKRNDEIGLLNSSFHTMLQKIQVKEEELLSQNEELIAQQEELQMQQEELQELLRKMEENEELLMSERALTRDIMDTIQEGIQFVNVEGIIVKANTTMNELFGIPEGQSLSNIQLAQFISSTSHAIEDSTDLKSFMISQLSEEAMEERSYMYEITSPTRRVIQAYAEPLYRETGRIGTVFVHRDMTKQAEVDQLKSEFVSTVSHELRTPLSSVLGFAERLLTKEMSPEKQQKYLKTIHQETVRLTALINDFLDVQRMESGKSTHQKNPVDLFEVLNGVFTLQLGSSSKHDFNVHIPSVPYVISGDQDNLTQLFMNLVSNAVKYSPEGGRITAKLYHVGNQVLVDITDEGLGIPGEAIPKLFTKFYRIDNSDRRSIGGTGLGLAIVKGIVEAHGGEISVTSKLGEGSTFRVSFPLNSMPEILIEEELLSAATDEFTGRTVALIEDDVSLTELLTEELTEKGFRVITYTTGEQALKDMPIKKPVAVIVDIMLNNSIDGWEIINLIKEDSTLHDLPIFISSALDDTEKGKEIGANMYFVKPYPPSQLSGMLLEILGLKRV